MHKVAFDIDGCLIDYFGKPQENMIALLKHFKKTGHEVYVWWWDGLC